MPQKRPVPNNPPSSYRIDLNEAVFFRRVSKAELESVRGSRRLESKLGGTEFGKHLTTTPKLALKWGQLKVDEGFEQEIGFVLEVRLSVTIAEEIYFVGSRIDDIGACYFARFDQLKGAKISEVTL